MTTTSSNRSNTAGGAVPRTCFEAVEGYDLTNRVYLVTGAYVGLGAATTRALLQAGGLVIVAGRNRQLQDAFVQELQKEGYGNDKIDGSHTLDLADLASVRDFSVYIEQTYPKIDVLILNAGVMATPYGATKQGLEIQMGVNAVGHFLLARRLADRVGRQVWVSSRGHSMFSSPPPKFDNARAPRIDVTAIATVKDDDEASYDTWRRYQQSKLANVLLAKQFASMGHEAVAIHPGMVMTNLFRHGNPLILYIFTTVQWIMGNPAQTPEQGARTQTLLAVQPKVESGGYYGKCVRDQEADAALHADDAQAIFEYCDKFTQEYQK